MVKNTGTAPSIPQRGKLEAVYEKAVHYYLFVVFGWNEHVIGKWCQPLEPIERIEPLKPLFLLPIIRSLAIQSI